MTEETCPFSNAEIPVLFKILAFIGAAFIAFVLLRFFISLCRGIYTCFVGQLLGFTIDLRKMGEWAVVTGASDGIGKAYAEELAKRGLNVVLLSRTLEKLQSVAADIEKATNVRTKVVAVDFTGDISIYDTIRRELEGLEVGVLVNNVGMSFPYAEYFTLVPEGDKLMDQMIKANCTAATMMMRIVLPEMEKRRRGVIINVSSISAMFPLPLLSTYAGTKAYMDYISQAVHAEYKDRGIFIQSVKPAFVSTKMSKIRKVSYDVPTPTTYVTEALRTVGIEHSTYGYLPHKLRGYMQEAMRAWLPDCLLMKISKDSLQAIRKGYYKKKGMTDTFLGSKSSAEGSGEKKSS
ncbi:very-long-chain 3-oxoacyl-CoA reductase-like [Ornithodoros turicata]